MPRAFFLGTVLVELTLIPLQFSHAISTHRDNYLQAIEYLRAGQWSRSKAMAAELQNYPLAPYLEYHRLSARLSQIGPAAIDAFRQQYGELPVTPLLYQRWLILQGKRRQWQTLHSRRYDTQNPELACYFARARYGIGEKDQALDATSMLWAQPKSQPKACDPLFAVWRKTPRFTQALIWQRFNGAMEERQYVLARYLQRYLDGDNLSAAKGYYELRRQPQRVAWRGAFAADTGPNRDAIIYGLTRLSTRAPEQAASAWQRFRQSHGFTPAQRQRLDDQIAVGLATDNIFPPNNQRDRVQSAFAVEGLLNAAIAHENWAEVVHWADRMQTDQENSSRAGYWLGRALLALEQQNDGQALLRGLAENRSYYGFLAAARLNTPTKLQRMQEHPFGAAEENALMQIPGVARAVELFAVGDDLNGRREWYRALANHDQAVQHDMAHLAQRIGRLFLAIQTANSAGVRDDLQIRFPDAYGSVFDAAALRHGVDGNLLRAIARQESAFQPKAQSSAGALGLMQIMPATGKIAIRRGGLKKHLGDDVGQAIKRDLRTPERNIEIGSYHFSWLMERYRGHRPLAIAAYNAGESRADRWMRDRAGLPMDVWIETIPFKETRNYVQNVLAFEVVYRNLNQRQAPILNDHEWQIPSG